MKTLTEYVTRVASMIIAILVIAFVAVAIGLLLIISGVI